VRKKSLEDGELSGIRSKLIGRMVFAVLMIVALLGGLALFDHFNSQRIEDEEDEPVFSLPSTPPVPPRRSDPPPAAFDAPSPVALEASPPVALEAPPVAPDTPHSPDAGKIEEPRPEAPKAASSRPTPTRRIEDPRVERVSEPTDPQAPKTRTSAPGADGPGPVESGSRSNRPRVRPAPPPVLEGSAAPVDRGIPKDDAPPRPEISPTPVLPPSRPRVSELPPSRVEGRPSVASLPLASASRLYSGIGLQAGVFSDPRRAEELHARLTLEGIPSTIEARVHVGPFKNRAEMTAAQARLKALGIDAVVLNPRGRR
jgi:cell division protein FtsN